RGLQQNIGCDLRVPANWSGRYRSIRAQFDFAVEEAFEPVMAGKYEDQVGRRDAKLQSEITTADFDKRRSAPSAIRESLRDKPLAELTAQTKGPLDNVRKHGYGFRAFHQLIGNTVFRNPHDFVKNIGRLDGAFALIIGRILRISGAESS